MGIINATPDSFSDGSELRASGSTSFQLDIDKALSRAAAMVSEGATFIDVGGESTRPGADEVSEQEQLDRVIPLIEKIHSNLDVCISIDTSSATVMLEAVAHGAELINDVRALSTPGALTTAGESGAAVCLMHMRGEPGTMQQQVKYDSVVDEVYAFLRQRVEVCIEAGIERTRLLVDPGFGFGKNLQHNYSLLRHLGRFAGLNIPVLVGISRKSMIGEVIQRPVDRRLAGSIAATMYALQAGASIIRTHDVAATMDAIRVNSAYSNAM